MLTKFWPAADEAALAEAAGILRQGGLVAFPTETVYGLGANGLSGPAVKSIFAAKGRPADNPMILHVSDKNMMRRLVKDIPAAAVKLIDAFWPGPLTLVLEKTDDVPAEVTAGLATVAVRMPAHAVACKLIAQTGLPLAAPSANLSGRPSPTDARAVREDLDGLIDGIIDGGAAEVGLESTVVDCTRAVPLILRPGSITAEQLASVAGEIHSAGHGRQETPRAPGMKYRHYAPRAPLYLLPERITGDLADLLPRVAAAGGKAGVIAQAGLLAGLPENGLARAWAKQEELAQGLYNWLREMDRQDARIILAQQVERKGLGQAIMNRLDKAAEGKVLSSAGELAACLQKVFL